MMLVHFPAALLPFGFLMDALGFFTGELSFSSAACYAYAGGVLLGCLAALFGSVDYFRISTEEQAWKTASLHALLNLVWISFFAYITGIRIAQFPHFAAATTSQLISTAVCVLGMTISNHLGGELVLRHGVGASYRHNR